MIAPLATRLRIIVWAVAALTVGLGALPQGQTSSAVTVPDGRWQVTVHSFEPRASGTGAQAMTIAAQGRRVGAPFNIAKAAGGPLKGVTRTFSAVIKLL